MATNFVALDDGRLVAYRELGCAADEAKRSLLVLHGLGSSRLAAIPGVSEELLREYGVRLVAIDRPGYGRSDLARHASLAMAAAEVEQIIDRLQLGADVWLLGYSGGAATCWAAARFIPHRLRGIALWAPVGNYWWKGISEGDRKAMLSSSRSIRLMSYMRLLPSLLVRMYTSFVLAPRAGQKWLEHCKATLCAPDREHLQLQEAAELMVRDNLESICFNKGSGIATDLELFSSDWGFELDDVARCFRGAIHIWQGSEDTLVPLKLQQVISSIIPGTVHLHELPGEGHLSWFCFRDDSHRQVFQTIFPTEGSDSHE